MSADAVRGELASEVSALIDRLSDGSRDDDARDALLERVTAWQRGRIAPFGRLRPGRGLPTDVFRYARIAAHPESEDTHVFLTSGTTHGARGAHPFRDLSLYDRAAKAAARHALFREHARMRLVMLAPRPEEAKSSSLSYMLGRFEAWFGTETRWVLRDGRVDATALDEALTPGDPIALLGTAFAFVHAEDLLGERRYALPAGSLVMQTGGTKGRSREITQDDLRSLVSARYGVEERRVIGEYGMTELSSQMYEDTLLGDGPRALWVPGWVRATVVDPDTLAPVPEGTLGVLRLDDLANLDSVCAIQTSDLALAQGDRIALHGRAPGAVPRGCSLAIEEALGGAGPAR